MTRDNTPPRADQGSVAVEVVLVAPLLIALLLLVAGLGRIAHTRGQVDGAAADAARTASLHRDPVQARQAGVDAARAHLGQRACRDLDVAIDTTGFRPGGQVTARVRCTASLAGLGLSGLPGTRTFTASAVAPLEAHRSR
ncbi:MAG: TadE/TadG family type IV pilus assembly protein [Sporichthyaceae bacterium]